MNNSITISKGQLSICHKGNCVNVKNDIAKVLVFGLATLVVVGSIASMFDTSN